MPYPIESFTYITKYYSNFFSFIYCFCKSIINIYELIDSRVLWCEARLERCDKTISDYIFVQIFENTSFKDLSNST